MNDQSGQESPAEAGPKTFEFLRKQSASSTSAAILDESRVIVDFGPATDLILQHAAVEKIDLIVMGLASSEWPKSSNRRPSSRLNGL